MSINRVDMQLKLKLDKNRYRYEIDIDVVVKMTMVRNLLLDKKSGSEMMNTF